mmetsp:Transcript_9007/g.25094  ORF Transcript_9007/g.25094 Transcript_9007/m.25094 type:complete len:200 (+) Transcript_9007:1119-1718(+)
MVLAVDTCLPAQTNLLVLLLRQALLIHLLELFNLTVSVLLQLRQRFLVVLESLILLSDDAVLRLAIGLLMLLELLLHALNDRLVLTHQRGVLRLPLLLFPLQVLRKLLVPLDLNQHLPLEGLFQLLGLLCVCVLQGPDILLVLQLTVCLLVAQDLEFPPLSLDLLAVFLLELGHLLFVVAVAVPQLEVDAACKLLNLAL